MYQGYTNWETWAVSLFFDNTYGVYMMLADETRKLRAAGRSDQEITTDLAERIEGHVRHVMPNPHMDIFNGHKAYLSVVNWEEAAESFVEE